MRLMRLIWLFPLSAALLWVGVTGYENVTRYGKLWPSQPRLMTGHDNVAFGCATPRDQLPEHLKAVWDTHCSEGHQPMRTLILPLALIVVCGGARAANVPQPTCSVGTPYVETDSIGGYETGCILPDGKKELHISALPESPPPTEAQRFQELANDIDRGFLAEMPDWQTSCASGQKPVQMPDGSKVVSGGCTVIVGKCAGMTQTSGGRNILLGDYTALPKPDTSGFVNIANRLCFWRDTGERVACPAPEPECVK
jgi:hypothetical protein